MKEKISSLDNKTLKDIDLDKSIFGVEFKEEIIHRMIRYQLSKRRSGNHKTKGISEISGTTRKPFKQKGTGSATDARLHQQPHNNYGLSNNYNRQNNLYPEMRAKRWCICSIIGIHRGLERCQKQSLGGM